MGLVSLGNQSKKFCELYFHKSYAVDYPSMGMNLFIFRTSCSPMFTDRVDDPPHSPLHSLV